jgi:hypothetical protein
VVLLKKEIKGGNRALIFGISFILSLLLAVEVKLIVIHQRHVGPAMLDMTNTDAIKDVNRQLERTMLISWLSMA